MSPACSVTSRTPGLPGVTRCDHLIRFEDFARAVADFERCLKPGGLLIIRHSNFRLRDAPMAERSGPATPPSPSIEWQAAQFPLPR